MEAGGMIPILNTLLLTILFLSLFVEIKTGGMGFGILLGLVAAGVFFGTQYAQGLVSMVQIAWFLGGILCLVLEMLTPTVGILAGIGIAAMLYSVLWAMGGTEQALYAMLAALVLSVAMFFLLLNRLPSSRLWRRVVLRDSSTTAQGYVSAPSLENLLGKEGVVLTELRPSGSVRIEGVPVDVVSEGAFLTKGTRVQVIAVQGQRVLVRKIE